MNQLWFIFRVFCLASSVLCLLSDTPCCARARLLPSTPQWVGGRGSVGRSVGGEGPLNEGGQWRGGGSSTRPPVSPGRSVVTPGWQHLLLLMLQWLLLLHRLLLLLLHPHLLLLLWPGHGDETGSHDDTHSRPLQREQITPLTPGELGTRSAHVYVHV